MNSGGQGDHLGASGANDHWGNGAMIVKGSAIGGLTPETVLAMNRVGGMVLGAIESHQQLVMKNAKALQQAVLFKALKDLEIDSIELIRHHGIKQVAYLIVTGDLFNAK